MPGDQNLWAEVQAELDRLCKNNPELTLAVTPILRANYESGRIASVQKFDEAFTTKKYVRRVVKNYQACHQSVYRFHKREEEVWEPFFEMLQRWAYKFLERRQFGNGDVQILFQHAKICATDAAMVIIEKPFPYDVKFEPWACRVLQNMCLRHMEAEMNIAMDGINTEIIELDSRENWVSNIKDHKGEQFLYRAELNNDLLTAMDQLASEDRKTLLVLYYFDEKSLAEIADILGKNINATYKLHYDALRNLRLVWENRN